MIIACPACSTRYVVPDASIGIEGRTVRCAKCRHSWHQDGPELDVLDLAAAPEAPREVPSKRSVEPPPPEPTVPPPVVSAPDEEPASEPDEPDEPEAEQTPPPPEQPEPETTPTVVETAPPPEPDYDPADDISQFDYEPPFRPRRNPLKMWTAAAAIFAVLAVGSVFAVSYLGLPDWVPVNRPTFAVAQPDLVLEFPDDQQDRRELPNGTEFFGLTGTITNTGRETRDVPPLLIVLRDERDRIVFDWVVEPPQSSLAPGEDMRVNEAITDVPKAAKFADIGWKPV